MKLLLTIVVLINLSKQMKKIYVGNLPFSATEDELQAAFGKYGEVVEINLPRRGRSHIIAGYALILMHDGFNEAAENLNNTDLGGNTIEVRLIDLNVGDFRF